MGGRVLSTKQLKFSVQSCKRSTIVNYDDIIFGSIVNFAAGTLQQLHRTLR